MIVESYFCVEDLHAYGVLFFQDLFDEAPRGRGAVAGEGGGVRVASCAVAEDRLRAVGGSPGGARAVIQLRGYGRASPRVAAT